MGNIVRWFEDFPLRALDLLPDMKALAGQRDRVGSLALLIAPALIVAPYERLQTYARRLNPQADYLTFPKAHDHFNQVMTTRFGEAQFWSPQSKGTAADWRGSQVPKIMPDPRAWQTANGYHAHQNEFWNVDIRAQDTKWVWLFLRDALSHWNVANADQGHHVFDEGGVMQRFIFYRARNDAGPWDVLSVSPESFLTFLEAWTSFLSRGFAHELLTQSEAA